MKTYFDKEMSVMLGGVAILLMMFHHLFAFPDRIPDPVAIDWGGSIGRISASYLASFGKICVYIFAFISGYALWIKQDSFRTYRQCGRRLLKFLCIYWSVVVLFLLTGFLNNDTLPSPTNLLLNLFGLRLGPASGWINVTHAWYVSYYIIFILACPLIIRGGDAKSQFRPI